MLFPSSSSSSLSSFFFFFSFSSFFFSLFFSPPPFLLLLLQLQRPRERPCLFVALAIPPSSSYSETTTPRQSRLPLRPLPQQLKPGRLPLVFKLRTAVRQSHLPVCRPLRTPQPHPPPPTSPHASHSTSSSSSSWLLVFCQKGLLL